MYHSFLMLRYDTNGKWFYDIRKQKKDIHVQPGTPIDILLKHYVQQLAIEKERWLGKSAEQRMHEAFLNMYRSMLETATTEAERWYAESHIQAHSKRLEEANERFRQKHETDQQRRAS